MTETATTSPPPAPLDYAAPSTKVSGPSKAARWTGIVISTLLVLWLGVLGTVFMLMQPAMVEENMTKMGYPPGSAVRIQIVLLACVILYAIPRTAVLGAILLTGYLGGAVATHVRAADGMWWMPVLFGVLVWLALYLRDTRVRDLTPLRKV